MRQVGLAHLEAARAARQRLGAGDDEEALHDFRVALRRLRSLLRAFRPLVEDTVSRKLRRRLRDLARLTGAARDAEVRMAWVRDARAKLPAGQRAGVAWWAARLAAERDAAYLKLHEDAVREFDKLGPRLRRALARPVTAAPQDTFGRAVGERLMAEATELERRLTLIHSIDDEVQAHGARIEVKRIRYLLEPLADDRAVAAVLKPLREAQDLLGALHDVQTLGTVLGDAAAQAAAERTRERHRITTNRPAPAAAPKRRARPSPAGLLALARLARAEEERLFRQLQRGRGLQALPSTLVTLTTQVSAAPPAASLPAPLPTPLEASNQTP